MCHAFPGCHKSFTDRGGPGIRTYSVVPLNEECGLIEWVRNTVPIRTIFKSLYDRRNLNLHVGHRYSTYLLILAYLLRYQGKGGNRGGGEGQDDGRGRCSEPLRRTGLELLPTCIPRMVC